MFDVKAINFKKRDSNAADGVKGLNNMGNTCYMNSSLQCISNIAPLRKYFFEGLFIDEINYDNVLGSKGDYISRFAELLHALWNKSGSSMTPSNYKKALGKVN